MIKFIYFHICVIKPRFSSFGFRVNVEERIRPEECMIKRIFED